MKLSRLLLLNLTHYRRLNLAIIAGVATAVAVLTGALLVGESVRNSLRDLIYQRIGATDFVIAADRFLREDLAGELSAADMSGEFVSGCPLISLPGILVHEATGYRVQNVNVYGVDDRFWRFHGVDPVPLRDRAAVVGTALANRLGAKEGDGLLLRIETQQGIPRESLYGRREEIGRTIRLVCSRILGAQNLGDFALQPHQGPVHSVFIPIQLLQKDLAQTSRANTVLLTAKSQGADLERIRDRLREKFALEDVGIRLQPIRWRRGISVESARVILDDSLARAAFGAAADVGAQASGVFTYLANSIRAGGREIPYSVITAVNFQQGAVTSVSAVKGSLEPSASSGEVDEIWLNEWAWRDLGAAIGDWLEVDYYLWQEEGRLATRTARLRLTGVVSIGGDVDADLAPEFPGITEAKNMNSWNPPFPLDLRRIRPKDEEYWNRYRTAPKAFVTLALGQKLWHSRFGKLSSLRVALPEGADWNVTRQRVEDSLRSRLDPEQEGFLVRDVRERALRASEGSTDFGEYFVYFSFFLIGASILLSALFFRLGVEQRVREIGTLQALGFSQSTLQRILLLEGILLSFGGGLLGLLGSIGYGWLLVFGLRNWWIGAVGTDQLFLHVSWKALAIGTGAGICVSLGTIAGTLRGLRRNSTRALLAGVLESIALRSRRARSLGIIAIVAFTAALMMILGATLRKISNVEGFFGAGCLLLVSILSLMARYLRRESPAPITGQGWQALIRLGARNASHRPGRSLLCVALIASATFIIVSVEAFRRDNQSVTLEPASGTGGYPLLAQSSLPIVYDLNSAEGREAMGIRESEVPALAQAVFVPFRLRPGDDASCLNLYAPEEPRVLGASHSFLASERFSFQDALASTPAQKRNPWLLLESETEDGTIPAIADANTIQYVLHREVGSEMTVPGGNGAPVRLRLVAALRDSLFQGELLISEANFLRAFPEQQGFRFFLLEAPAPVAASLVQPLQERLANWGFSIESCRDRLLNYHQVENTYLSTFQSLGALGLILGTVGLATVLLRNVLERRQELALLRAVGYSRQILSGIILAENLALLIWGLIGGTLCAGLAILPALNARGLPFQAAAIGLTLTGIVVAGMISSLLATIAALRSPLLDALRSE